MAKKDKTKKGSKYSESDISGFFSDIEKIQAKPALYIGELGQAGINTIVREPCDNSVDEARAGRNTLVNIMIPKDGSYWVQDEGVGIPVKMHPKMKISTLTHVLTNLQSSGKMQGSAYKSAIGTHGVGIKATNAFSREFEVWTYRKDAGGWHYTKFERGVEKVKPKKVTKPPKLPNGKRPKLGTILRFVPDEKYFGKEKINIDQLKNWCEMTSYMNVGLRIQLLDGKKQYEWVSKLGIREYLEKRLKDLKATPISKNRYVFHNSESLELAVYFTDVEGSAMEFFTNTIRNAEAGVHADDMYKALVEALKPFKGKLHYTPSDLKEGLVGVLNYKINAPMFDSQTKEKLVDNRVKGQCYKECLEVFEKFFKENKSLAKDLVQRAAELRKRTADFLKDKKLIKKVKAASKGLSAKLADVSNTKTPIEDRELYLVEGDSAGGSSKVARFRDFQAVFSLKGKPLNVMEATKDRVNKNAEIAGIFAGIGLDLGHKDPISKIRFGKIIILADADVDGPVVGSTPVLTLDGRNPTIKELYEQWLRDKQPVWVLSRNEVGELVPAQGIPRFIKKFRKLVRITLDNGTVLKCTTSHKWMMADQDADDPRRIEYLGNEFVKATDLKVGDRLDSVYFTKSLIVDGVDKSDLSKFIDKNRHNHRIAKIRVVKLRKPMDFYCMSVPETGNFFFADKNGNGVGSSNCHIRTLLYTLFWKYLPDLIKQGRLYVVDSPEFITHYKGKLYFGSSKEDLYNQVGTRKIDIRHLKGWGEANAEDLQPMAFDPKTRRLFRVLPPKDKAGALQFQALMGKSPAYRQQLLGVANGKEVKANEKDKKAKVEKITNTGRSKVEKRSKKAVRRSSR